MLSYKIKKIDGEWAAIAYLDGKRNEDMTYYSGGSEKDYKQDCIRTSELEIARWNNN